MQPRRIFPHLYYIYRPFAPHFSPKRPVCTASVRSALPHIRLDTHHAPHHARGQTEAAAPPFLHFMRASAPASPQNPQLGTQFHLTFAYNLSHFQINPSVLSLRGRETAAAIFNGTICHPETKHGSTKRQDPEIPIRPAGTPQRAQRAQLRADRVCTSPAQRTSRGQRLNSPFPILRPQSHPYTFQIVVLFCTAQ